METNTSFHFDVLFFRRFWELLKVMFPRWRSITSLLFLLLLCIVILEQVVVYQVGMIPSKYYKVLGEKDLVGFKKATFQAFLTVGSVAFILSTDKYVCSVLYVTWRDQITKYIHKIYFQDINYFQLNVLDDTIDNPDQRITQDVNKVCKEFSQIIAQLLISPFTIAYYVYKTWQTAGYIGPVCVFAFFIVSTVINKFIMSPVVEMVFRQERREGDFRFKHMHVRVNAESAGFYRAGKVELTHTNNRFNKLLKTQQRLVLWEYPLNFVVNSAAYTGSILSYIIVGIPIFSGWYDDLPNSDLSSLISQNSFFIMYLINCFTKLIDMAVGVVDIAGTTHRVGQLTERLSKLRHQVPDDISPTDSPNGYLNNALVSSITSSDASVTRVETAFTADKVTYGVPNSFNILVKDLTLKIVTGVNMVITGDSGCGKSSLFRVLDGLWPIISGRIDRQVAHGPKGVLFLPQKPYFTDGTLREQIIFPNRDSAFTVAEDGQILELLGEADLVSLYDRIGGLDVPIDWNWYDQLSPGEMQRLSFVRLFFHSPPFAMLDEATSQVSVDMEAKLYKLCARHNITVISVGHRQSLHAFHDVELKLDGRGGWQLLQIKL